MYRKKFTGLVACVFGLIYLVACQPSTQKVAPNIEPTDIPDTVPIMIDSVTGLG